MQTGMLDQLWTSIADAGRDLLRGRIGGRRRTSLESLCRDLLSTKGEASGAALARELLETYSAMPATERLGFFTRLAEDYGTNHADVMAAIEAFRKKCTEMVTPISTLVRKMTPSPSICATRRSIRCFSILKSGMP